MVSRGAPLGAVAEGREDLEDEAEFARSAKSEPESDLSSVPSMSRQCTEFSEAVGFDIASRQVSDFACKQSDFWVRKCTEPVFKSRSSATDGVDGGSQFMGRQTSCPVLGTSSMIIEDAVTGPQAEIPEVVEEEEEEDAISRAICAAVSESDFPVSVADPTGLDYELIAVSQAFESLTAYQAEEIVGENCRFLSRDCPQEASQAEALRTACETGAPFTSVLVNRRKTGELFLNLLTLQGLILARDEQSGQDIWILIGVQKDITGMESHQVPLNNKPELLKLGNRIHRRLLKYAAELGISFALSGRAGSTAGMQLLGDVIWKTGEQLGLPPHDALKALSGVPDLSEHCKVLGTISRQLGAVDGISLTESLPDKGRESSTSLAPAVAAIFLTGGLVLLAAAFKFRKK